MKVRSRIRYVPLVVLVFLAPLISPGASLQCQHLPQLFEVYFRHHYMYHGLNDDLKAHTVEQYIKSLDPSKQLLMEADVAKLRKDLPDVFKTIKSTGKCPALDASSALVLERAKENQAIVLETLSDKYKLDENVEFVLDPKKRSYFKTADDKKEFVKKMVHFQISNLLLTDNKLPEAKKQLIHRYELVTKRLVEKKQEDVVGNWVDAFALALDPHSSFLSRDSMEDLQIQMQLSLDGIGASLTSQDGFTVIEQLIPGGAAEKTKLLRPKDKIIAVAQDGQKPVSVIDTDLRYVVAMIRGKKGTKVKLTILRQAETTQTLDVTIVRDKIDIKGQAAKITYETRKSGDKTFKIGVIELPSFYGGGGKEGRSSSTDLKKLLEEANKKKVDGIVLNLASNGGGLLDEAYKTAGLFIGKVPVVGTKSTEGRVKVLADDEDEISYTGPMAVVISRLSASASEILAGALKDYKRAIIVGSDHTFGKGSVQVVSGLPLDLGGMKVTTEMFFLPGGVSTQHVGVSSDVRLPSTFNDEDVGEKILDYPLPPQTIKPFTAKDANPATPGKHWDPVNDSTFKKLAEKSSARTSKDAKFLEIKKTIEESIKNAGVVKLADLRKKAKKDKDKDKGKKKDDKEKDEFGTREIEMPLVQEGVNIIVDYITSKNQMASSN